MYYVISVFIVFTWRFLIIVSSPFLDDFMVFIYRLFDTVISRSARLYGDPKPWYAFLTMLGLLYILILFGHSIILGLLSFSIVSTSSYVPHFSSLQAVFVYREAEARRTRDAPTPKPEVESRDRRSIGASGRRDAATRREESDV